MHVLHCAAASLPNGKQRQFKGSTPFKASPGAFRHPPFAVCRCERGSLHGASARTRPYLLLILCKGRARVRDLTRFTCIFLRGREISTPYSKGVANGSAPPRRTYFPPLRTGPLFLAIFDRRCLLFLFAVPFCLAFFISLRTSGGRICFVAGGG